MIRSLSSTPQAPCSAVTASRVCAQGCRIVMVAVLLAACSGGGGASSDTSAPPATAGPTTTSSPFDAAQTVTTTGAPYSREAREALLRCIDSITSFESLVNLEAEFGRTDTLDEAYDLCDEAQLQLEVDGDRRLATPIASLMVDLALTRLEITLDSADGVMDDHAAKITELQTACDEFTRLANDAIS